MKKWQKNAIAFSIAATLALPIALPAINVADAASQKAAHKVDVQDRVTLQQTKLSAASGKVINSENFGIDSSTKDIIKKWGKPSVGSDADFLYYDKRNVNFQAIKGKVISVISFDKRFSSVSYQEALKVYGKPVSQSFGDDGVYLDYAVGTRKLTLSFAYDKKGTKPDTLRYVQVQ